MTKKLCILLLVCCVTLPVFTGTASANDWYVRLIVTAPDDPEPVRVDDGNVFGRWFGSVDGMDGADLGEMPPPAGSTGDRYLSIVFPHPEWGGEYDNYASDFRGPVTDETRGDSWKFEVQTRTPGIRTVISWQEWENNPFAILPGISLKILQPEQFWLRMPA